MTTWVRTLVFGSGTSLGPGPKILGTDPNIRVPEKIPYIWVPHFGILLPWVCPWIDVNVLHPRTQYLNLTAMFLINPSKELRVFVFASLLSGICSRCRSQTGVGRRGSSAAQVRGEGSSGLIQEVVPAAQPVQGARNSRPGAELLR